jgi:CheY-like chemotaxis protein
MKKSPDPLGRLMLQAGLVDDTGLADLLAEQRRPLPLASIAFMLGYGDEEALVRLLSRQRGIPGVILSRSIIPLGLLKRIPRELAFRLTLLPLREDETRLFVAFSDALGPEELQTLRLSPDKSVVPHVALHAVARRALREAYRALAQGERFWFGSASESAVEPPPEGSMRVVSDVDELPLDLSVSAPAGPPGGAELEGETNSLVDSTPNAWDVESGELPGQDPDQAEVMWAADGTEVTSFQDVERAGAEGSGLTTGLDGAGGSAARRPATVASRVLLAEPNGLLRQRTTSFLFEAGYTVVAVSTGSEAIQKLKQEPFDVVVAEVGLSDVGGFAICRSIKNSQKYRHIAVVLMSAPGSDVATVDSELLEKYSVDGYLAKPIALSKVVRCIGEVLRERKQPEPDKRGRSDNFQEVMALYRQGDTDGAIALLRAGLAVDPLSARHHFMLANLLQRRGATYEAIDEYEATLHLKPTYFPALSRLAFLYYKQGFTSKAVEAWRRALPVCPDPALRRNIEAFLRRLPAERKG